MVVLQAIKDEILGKDESGEEDEGVDDEGGESDSEEEEEQAQQNMAIQVLDHMSAAICLFLRSCTPSSATLSSSGCLLHAVHRVSPHCQPTMKPVLLAALYTWQLLLGSRTCLRLAAMYCRRTKPRPI